MDGSFLYVTNNGSSSFTVIDLRRDSVVQTVTLNAKPEGVAAGADGRVLISTEGTSSDALPVKLRIGESTAQPAVRSCRRLRWSE